MSNDVHYHLLLSAKICLLKSSDNKVYPLAKIQHTLTTREFGELMENIRARDLLVESLQYALPLVERRMNIYSGDDAYLSAVVSCDPARLTDMFYFYLTGFTVTACDGYLTGDDAVVFRQNEKEYSLILDDIRAVVYEHKTKRYVKGLKMLNYWIPAPISAPTNERI